MIKRILKIWFIIAVYELSKYITNELIVMLQSEDDIDTAPNDYALETDQYDLNRIKAEVSE
ncbi:transcriptional activator RinB [Staphylococcus hominis]|mgnify:FL=1|uniref:Regulator n=1 Tax=Staphylococcus hominis TaxID=1290 RepID=A0A6N0I1Q0_STAHO|nr:regulator [Staphylococcus hominis]MCI2926655.1 transcriptional activator RinB [Staphylococcus hominis]QKQ28550.1 regulator [Staphylococcus hominis]